MANLLLRNARGRFRKTSRIKQFWLNVQKTATCWNWIASRDSSGYGHFWDDNILIGAHRWSYKHFVGPIPDGLTIDHLCRNPACVNPKHLEPVTNVENIMRGNGVAAQNARKTHCKRGHEFTETNTRIDNSRRNPGRICKKCKKMHNGKALKGSR